MTSPLLLLLWYLKWVSQKVTELGSSVDDYASGRLRLSHSGKTPTMKALAELSILLEMDSLIGSNLLYFIKLFK